MKDFDIQFEVENYKAPPMVDVHYEAFGQYALWLSGKYGNCVSDGSELGLSPRLISDLNAWCEAEDALYDPNDPPNSGSTEGFREKGFALAKRVRAELPVEWVVTTWDPFLKTNVELPRHS